MARSRTSTSFTVRPSCDGSGLRKASTRKALTASACFRDASDCASAFCVWACARSVSARAPRLIVIGLGEGAVGLRLHAGHGRQPDHARHQGDDRGGNAGSVAPRPPARAPREGLAPRRHRFIRGPALEVLGQRRHEG